MAGLQIALNLHVTDKYRSNLVKYEDTSLTQMVCSIISHWVLGYIIIFVGYFTSIACNKYSQVKISNDVLWYCYFC